MDYEKKYNKLVEAIKVLQKTNPSDESIQNWVNDNVPELNESEDERIRKALIALVKSKEEDGYMVINNFSTGSILAWLEKQGKQKHAWSEENEAVLDALIRSLEGEDIYVSPHLAAECLKSIKDRVQPQPKQKWSEEDEHRLKDTIYFLDTAKKHYASTVELDACINWLKTLRPQNRWKPSDEQINAIRLARSFVVDDFNEHPTLSEILIELEEQLQKIKENTL